MALLGREKRILFATGNSLAIVMPAKMVDELNWKEGDELTIDLEEKSKGRFVSVYK